jgi:membrane fusion protein, heavy metal efflux system
LTTAPTSFRKRLIIFLMLLFMVGGGALYLLGVSIPGFGVKANERPSAAAAPLKVELVENSPHTLSVPEEVRKSLGIRKGGKDIVAVAQMPKQNRRVTLSASTLFDPASIYRIRIRFTPADVVKGEKTAQITDEGTIFRPIRPGAEIAAKQPLAELYSVDLGAKKNDLIDALVQLKSDKEVLENAEISGAAAPRALMITFEKAVQADIANAKRAKSYLEAWKLPPDEIEAIYQEADKIFNDQKIRGKELKFDKSYDPDKPNKWGKFVVRAPADSVLVESNVAEGETLLDPTLNLFTLAKVDKLLVMANAPEEDVKELYAAWKKSAGLRWTIRTLGEPNSDGIPAQIDEIGFLADPNTHTIPIKGVIPNKDKILRAGQYVTATVELPAPKDVMEIPADAVVDDGKQTVVFVQSDPSKGEFTMRRVMVTHRFKNKVYVRTSLSEKEKELTPEEETAGLMPKQPLRENEKVITAGVLELKKELEDREGDKVK